MVAYTGYETDSRVRRYAETLQRRGCQVDVVALRQEDESSRAVVEGVRVYRIQRRICNEKSRIEYLTKLLLFFFRSLAFLTRLHLKERYDLIHVHSVPDFEVFAALIPKLLGCRVILDIHDIVPEFYASKFNTSPKSMTFKLLVAVERLSAAFSDHVIVANHIWHERLRQRSIHNGKCTALLNYPDTGLFRKRGRVRNDGKFIMLYPGTLNYHQGLDLAIRAFARLQERAPQAEFHIYGKGDQMNALRNLIDELHLQNRVFLRGTVPTEEISVIMENADLGVVPKRKNSFGNEAFSTKTLEFMCLGVPLIVPDTMVDRYYFNDSVVKFFEANDEESLASVMLTMIENPVLRESLVNNASEFVKHYLWDVHEESYLNIVSSLLNQRTGLNGNAKRDSSHATSAQPRL
jgi:glycosyltransferase involved in cell wall biosynthesis